MKRTEVKDPLTGVPIEQSELPVYLPATPSTAFVEYVELFVGKLFR